MKGMNRKKGLILVIIGAVLWGISGTVSQKLFQQYHVNVNGLVTIRLLVAGVLLLGMQSFRSTRSHVFGVWRNKWSALRLVIFGLLGMLAVQYTYMASIKHGNAAVATLLQYLAPVMIILYLLLRRQTVFTRHDAVTVLLALMGCFLLLTNGSVSNLSVPPVAVAWGILSGLALAFYTLYSVPLLAQFDSQVIVGWAMIIGGVALSLIHPPWQIDFSGFSPVAYMYLLFVIVFGTMLAFWFYIESLQSLSPKETSLFSSLEPLAAVLTTVFWLKEPFGIFQWVGTLCIFGMILLLAFQKKPSSKAEKVAETNYDEKSDVG
ncbi:EamA family transporter [Rummeliibacillus stabekisii]|uniref:EamA family transporter n=1 Tax=Rummeliibacillus stabekisii TaxID=241244 RepID=UPI00203E5328|nr:EamA family transporter [Rummeliibacillus stabekisii]MCM3317426.1 EamA family transporter [Rummeliibacillus stabekisii]